MRAQDNFEQTMYAVKNNIQGKQHLFANDNFVKKDFSADLHPSELRTRYPFFSSCEFILRGTILTATANQEERHLKNEELASIPYIGNKNTQKFKICYQRYDEMSQEPIEICVEAPGLKLSQIKYFRSENILFIWGTREQTETRGTLLKSTMPQTRAIEILAPTYLKHAPHFETSGTGFLFIRPSQHELQNNPASSIASNSPLSG